MAEETNRSGPVAVGRVLIVDDEVNMQVVLSGAFEDAGHAVQTASNGTEATERLRESDFDLIILDLRLPDMSGIDVFRIARGLRPGIVVIMVTAYSSVETAIQALKMGAYDYVIKPFNVEKLLMMAANAIAGRHHAGKPDRSLASSAVATAGHEEFEGVIGASPQMRKVMEMVRDLAPTNATVLIYGESGTGKELLADYIHKMSLRAGRPLVKVNCAAIPESLLESEMFGHEKGAFTHAVSRRFGRFEVANSGTIFLDEIGEMSPAMQAKLLRVLQEKEFERVGGTETVKVDVRVIAATNRNLRQAIAEGAFREDLYYRLSVVPLFMPPLRQRMQDIPMLVSRFIDKYNREFGRTARGLSPEAAQAVAAYAWPGNIRELENAIERAVLLSRGDLLTPEYLHLGQDPGDAMCGLRTIASSANGAGVTPVQAGRSMASGVLLHSSLASTAAGSEFVAASTRSSAVASESGFASVSSFAPSRASWLAYTHASAAPLAPGSNGPNELAAISPGVESEAASVAGDAFSLDEMERRHIRAVLEQTGENRTQAAKILGITRRTLLNKINKYGL